MPLPKHSRTQAGNFRQANGTELAKNLRKDYPEFYKVRSDAKLENLRKRFGVTSINAVREALRKRSK